MDRNNNTILFDCTCTLIRVILITYIFNAILAIIIWSVKEKQLLTSFFTDAHTLRYRHVVK